MTIFIGHSTSANRALRVAATRGSVRRLARRIYSSDLDRDPATQIRENLLGILGRLLPDWHLSYSSAVTLAPVGGLVFLSGTVSNYRRINLPGVTVVRQKDIRHPEFEWIEAPTLIGTTLENDPEVVRVGLSSPLQSVFECLRPARRYKEKQLPHPKLIELVRDLSSADRARAESFATRNDLQSELRRFMNLVEATEAGDALAIRRPNRLETFFYGWRVGTLAALGTHEFRFEYAPEWRVELSGELPLSTATRMSYEGPRLPAFFENLLPEGWTESWLSAAHKIAREDVFGMLTTTSKYLSNITLRPPEFPTGQLAFDTHSAFLKDIAPRQDVVLKVRDEIREDPESRDLWLALRNQGGVRLSGIQPKLPVSMATRGGRPVLCLGGLRNACGHILKLESAVYPNLIENEWATMELARRIGLPTPDLRMVEFEPTSRLRGRALLIERFDIPTAKSLEAGGDGLRLPIIEDVCSRLLLPRSEKYAVSLERVATALQEAGVSLWAFFKHVLFSWIIGNGDLHTKNISLIRWLKPGQLGSSPSALTCEYSPVYDLLNTRLPLPGDQFALTMNGRRDRLRVRDFEALASRWGAARDEVRDVAGTLVEAVFDHLSDVLNASRLADAESDRYRRVVEENVRQWRL
ncbi:MAG: HipA domain-containing protein [Dehalococcoidia bacterium]